MPRRTDLPQMNGHVVLTYTGMETDLVFTQGVDLPGFASFPLLETEQGCAQLKKYCQDLIAVGKETGLAVTLESPTWVANRDRAATLGYTAEQLHSLNLHAIELMAEAKQGAGDVPTLISANIGPRDDAYDPSFLMTASEAEDYHTEQMSTLAQTDIDFVTGYTIAYPDEAIGIVRAAKRYDLPVVIAFTVETDGHLVDGVCLGDAIDQVDRATENHACYFMINCAHPDHFSGQLNQAVCVQRLKGIVANASRCSHAELDEAERLDDGDPVELGQQLANLRQEFPYLTVFGGCCGTDMRHLRQIGHRLGLIG